MKLQGLLCILTFFSLSVSEAQEKTTPPPDQKSGVQDIVRVVPELLPQAIRDTINSHQIDGDAEIASAEQLSLDGRLRFKVNFRKDEKTWSKIYDTEGRHIDEGRREEFLLDFNLNK